MWVARVGHDLKGINFIIKQLEEGYQYQTLIIFAWIFGLFAKETFVQEHEGLDVSGLDCSGLDVSSSCVIDGIVIETL